jgi:hypothetical protein
MQVGKWLELQGWTTQAARPISLHKPQREYSGGLQSRGSAPTPLVTGGWADEMAASEMAC